MPYTSSQSFTDNFRMQMTSNDKILTEAEERHLFTLQIPRMTACLELNRLEF